jgi:phosphatidylserine/phosphatidylglycerophosphate/cardiolipin synthase-like enzyme
MRKPLFDVQCDIYIGRGAGTKLLADIKAAKKKVTIVSPYLSPEIVGMLIDLHQRNIEIKLISTDNIPNFSERNENISRLIQQKREIDQVAVTKRENLLHTMKVLLYVMIGLSLMLLTYFLVTRDLKAVLGIIPIGVIYAIRKLYLNKYRMTTIYSYWYKPLFPFKVFYSPDRKSGYQNDFLIHSKMYLIDDEIAYLGSVNFTHAGTHNNYETRIRTTDAVAINEIRYEIDQLFHNKILRERDIQLWGQQIYFEPIN